MNRITLISIALAMAVPACAETHCTGMEPADMASAAVVQDGGSCPELAPGALRYCADLSTDTRGEAVCAVSSWSCQGVDLVGGGHLARLDLAGVVVDTDEGPALIADGSGYVADGGAGTPCAARYVITVAR